MPTLPPLEPADVERDIDGVGVVLHAHEPSYGLCRQESHARRMGAA